MKKKTVEFSGAHNSLIHISGEELKTLSWGPSASGFTIRGQKAIYKAQSKVKERRYALYLFRWLPRPVWWRKRKEVYGS